MDLIQIMVYKIGVLEKTYLDFYNKYNHHFARNECFDGNSFYES